MSCVLGVNGWKLDMSFRGAGGGGGTYRGEFKASGNDLSSFNRWK